VDWVQYLPVFLEDLGDETGDGVSSLRYCRLVEQPRFPTMGKSVYCSIGNVERGWEAIPRKLSPVILLTQNNIIILRCESARVEYSYVIDSSRWHMYKVLWSCSPCIMCQQPYYTVTSTDQSDYCAVTALLNRRERNRVQ